MMMSNPHSRRVAAALLLLGSLGAWTLARSPAYSARPSAAPPARPALFQSAPSAPQTHFTVHATRTGNNATIIFPAAAAAAVLQPGDEIAVFTRAGLCVGTLVWQGKNAALTAWGDDPLTPEVEGLLPQEPMAFRIWDAANEVEYGQGRSSVQVRFSSEKPYLQTGVPYEADGIYVVESLTVQFAGN